jgi:hypothetical protein
VIRATRKPLSRDDVAEEQYEWLDRKKNHQLLNDPVRDGYEAGPAIEDVAETVPVAEGDGAAVPESTAEKLARLDSMGLLDAMIETAEDHGVEATGEALANAGGRST